MAAKRRKKHKNKNSEIVISDSYKIKIRDFRLFTSLSIVNSLKGRISNQKFMNQCPKETHHSREIFHHLPVRMISFSRSGGVYPRPQTSENTAGSNTFQGGLTSGSAFFAIHTKPDSSVPGPLRFEDKMEPRLAWLQLHSFDAFGYPAPILPCRPISGNLLP